MDPTVGKDSGRSPGSRRAASVPLRLGGGLVAASTVAGLVGFFGPGGADSSASVSAAGLAAPFGGALVDYALLTAFALLALVALRPRR
jgi:hypothetical protein